MVSVTVLKVVIGTKQNARGRAQDNLYSCKTWCAFQVSSSFLYFIKKKREFNEGAHYRYHLLLKIVMIKWLSYDKLSNNI